MVSLTISTAGKITSDWLAAFIGPYVKSKGISDSRVIERMRNSMNELITKRFVEAVSLADNRAKAQLTDMGNLLLRYICTP